MAAKRSIGVALRENRERAGLTQSKVADDVGIAQGQLSNIETGKNDDPGWALVARIARAIGTSLDSIANDTVSGSKQPAATISVSPTQPATSDKTAARSPGPPTVLSLTDDLAELEERLGSVLDLLPRLEAVLPDLEAAARRRGKRSQK